jgi:hypothetical protein
MNSFPAVKCRTVRIMKHGNRSGGHKSLEEPAICHVDDREPDFPQKVMNAGLSGLFVVHHPCAQANVALDCRRVADIGPMIEI